MLNLPIKPMLLHKSDSVPNGDYIHQLKFDGFRCLLSNVQDQGVKLFTRHQNECTNQFPELQSVSILAKNAVLDGEMVVLGEDAKPCFESVMERFQARKEVNVSRLLKSLPVVYMAFDILYLNGEDVTRRPLEERLQMLSEVVQPDQYISFVQSFEDGASLFGATVNMGLEGIVSKRKGSAYMLDTRSPHWLKVKNYQYETVEIGGIRKGEFAWSILKDGKYVGTCEFVPPKERQAFYQISKQIVRKEDKNWIYLEPLIKCKVKFQCWTKTGLMRSPSFVEFAY